MKKILLLLSILVTFSCSEEDSPNEKTLIVFSMSTSVSPSEGGSIIGVSETYKDGEEATLTAIPSKDFEFIEWQGDIRGSENPIKIVMSSDKDVFAVFEKKVYSLNFDIIGKWYIQNSNKNNTSTVNKKIIKQSEASNCSIISIEFREDGTYTMVTDKGEVEGKYVINSNNSIDLGVGKIEDISFINDVLSFTVTLDSGCAVSSNAQLLTYVPDNVFESELIKLGYDNTLDNFVNTGNIRTVKTLTFEISSEQIVDFTGLEDFSALENFGVFMKDYKAPQFEIDFTSNLNLKFLQLSGVGITDLNLEKNSLIEIINLSRTSLWGPISFPNNPLLLKVQISENYQSQGTYINIDFTNNPILNRFDSVGTVIEKLDITNNPKMEVLNVLYGGVQEIITSGVYEDFEVFSVTGTQYNGLIDFAKFPNLEILFVQSNLESIDISSNTKLTWLKLPRAPNMKSLDLSNNPSLRDFFISDAPNLKCIEVNTEQLTKLDAEELYWTSGYNYSLECE